MKNTEPLTVDFTQQDSILQILPNPAQLRQPVAWNHVYFGHYCQPSHETPQYCSPQHSLSIHLGRAIAVERWWGSGSFQREIVIHGDATIYAANVPQKQRWDRECEFIELYFPPQLFAQAAYESISSEIELMPLRTTRDPLIQQIGLLLKTELESESIFNRTAVLSKGSKLYVESLLNTLVIHLLRHYSTQKEIQNPLGGLPLYKLKTAIAYIHEYLDRDISLAELAALANMSPHYFADLFKRSTGFTPHQYLTHCRIEKAKRLLAKPDLPIVDICQQVGFQSQSYFTKLFRRSTKLTPKAYRDSL